MSNFTPGKWQHVQGNYGSAIEIVTKLDGDSEDVSTVDALPDDYRLMKTAPRLLASLKEMVANVVSSDQGYLFIKHAKAVIAEAEGESNDKRKIL